VENCIILRTSGSCLCGVWVSKPSRLQPHDRRTLPLLRSSFPSRQTNNNNKSNYETVRHRGRGESRTRSSRYPPKSPISPKDRAVHWMLWIIKKNKHQDAP
jgi:hypothetical protein